MVIDKNLLESYFSNREHLFFIWDEKDEFILNDEYFSLDYLSFFIPITGFIDIKTDLHVLHAESSHIQFFIHNQSVKIIKVSEDYTSVGIIFSKKYWNHTLVHSHPFLTLSVFHPVLALSEQQIKILYQFYLVIINLKKDGYSDSNPVIVNLVLGLFFYIGRFYEKWSLSFPKNSDNKVVADFTSLLYRYYREHRDVNFYAKELHLSYGRFAHIIKSSIGLSPYQCIEKYTIMKICAMLKNTDIPIKEIAYNFNFNDSSHFCKFFKKLVGQAPLEFRKQYMISFPEMIDISFNK